MKRMLLFVALAVPTSALGISIDSPVTDAAGVLRPEVERELDARIRAHHAQTGVQLAVVTVASTGGVVIDSFALELAERWGGGAAGRDDGLLYVLAVKDRQQRLEVGYGLEGVIPDVVAHRILTAAHPALGSEQYDEAVVGIVDAVMDRTKGLRPGKARPQRAGVALGLPWVSTYLFLWLFGAGTSLAILVVARRLQRRKSSPIGRVPAALVIVMVTLIGAFYSARFGGAAWASGAAVTLVGGLSTMACVRAFRKKGRWNGVGAMMALGIFPAPFILNLIPMPWLDDPELLVAVFPFHLILWIFLAIPFLVFWIVAWTIFAPKKNLPEGSSPWFFSIGTGSSSTSSSSSRSSSRSSSSSFRGGGGRFGGGGASSSW